MARRYHPHHHWPLDLGCIGGFMQTNFERLQKQYPVFRYLSFNYNLIPQGLQITFAFEVGEHKFFPQLIFRGVEAKQIERIDPRVLKNLIFNLGLAEIPSYWKLACSPIVSIEAGYLNSFQVAFWKKLIEKGMGEFFFVNDIVPFTPEFKIKTSPESSIEVPRVHASDKVLVPVGGGKDSIVTMELVNHARKEITIFTIGKDEASEEIIEVFTKKHGQVDRIQVDRILDPKLLELNARGFLNGHTPFSSVVAFNSVFAALVWRLPVITLSNEKSANEETGIYNGVNINHQYSKTFEFESDFRAYMETNFPGAPEYFSLLRPLYEIEIMKLFVKYPQYFSVFRSCNVGKKTNSWCGDCAKCLFVSLLLSAFLPPEQVTGIFGKDLLSDPDLVPLLARLTGDAPMKAFECVGTRAETILALYLAWKRRRAEPILPAVIASYAKYLESHQNDLEEQAKEMLSAFDQSHFIPENFVKVVKDAIR